MYFCIIYYMWQWHICNALVYIYSRLLAIKIFMYVLFMYDWNKSMHVQEGNQNQERKLPFQTTKILHSQARFDERRMILNIQWRFLHYITKFAELKHTMELRFMVCIYVCICSSFISVKYEGTVLSERRRSITAFPVQLRA